MRSSCIEAERGTQGPPPLTSSRPRRSRTARALLNERPTPQHPIVTQATLLVKKEDVDKGVFDMDLRSSLHINLPS
ncbi:unnamed protein product [Sympodiomycopsis kandeliae]